MKFGVPGGTFTKSSSKDIPPVARLSSGFDQFQMGLKGRHDLSILDMSGVSQANIGFITEAGHRISSADIVGAMLEAFGEKFVEQQQSALSPPRFLSEFFSFPAESFDGILAWDAFQFLSPPLINRAVEQTIRILKPGGSILAFFNANEKVKEIPVYSYRIQDAKTLVQHPRGISLPVQNFNNRSVEKLFEEASSVKFFLTRDNLREILVRR